MKDRIVEHPGRYQLVPVQGTSDQYDFIPVPGEVTEEGTAYNKANQLSDETAEMYGGVITVNDALKRGLNLSSFIAFCTNANTESLDAAFGKGNENRVRGIGLQLAMYAWFKGTDKALYPFSKLIVCDNIQDCLEFASDEILNNTYIYSLMQNSPYVNNLMSTGNGAKSLLIINYGITGIYNSLPDLLSDDAALVEMVRATPIKTDAFFAKLLEDNNAAIVSTLQGSSKFTYTTVDRDSRYSWTGSPTYNPANSFVNIVSAYNTNIKITFQITLVRVYDNKVLANLNLPINAGTVPVNSQFVLGGIKQTSIFENNASGTIMGVYTAI